MSSAFSRFAVARDTLAVQLREMGFSKVPFIKLAAIHAVLGYGTGAVVEAERPGFSGRADSVFFGIGRALRRGDGGMVSSFKERNLSDSTFELLKSLFFGFPKRSSCDFSNLDLFSFLCFSRTEGLITAKALTGSAIPIAISIITGIKLFIFKYPLNFSEDTTLINILRS